jgi:hypothetical protein
MVSRSWRSGSGPVLRKVAEGMFRVGKTKVQSAVKKSSSRQPWCGETLVCPFVRLRVLLAVGILSTAAGTVIYVRRSVDFLLPLAFWR